MTLDRLFVECSALGFQSVLTSTLALTCYVLWLRHRGPHFLTWSMAWALYVVRLGSMSAFLVRRDLDLAVRAPGDDRPERVAAAGRRPAAVRQSTVAGRGTRSIVPHRDRAGRGCRST